MNNLKELREEKNMTQAELGKEIGVSGRSIGFYESGKRKPKLDVAIKIANFFGESVKYVFSDLSKKKAS